MTHEIPVLRELVVLASVSLLVVLLFQRLRLPAMMGFMTAGILIGPGGFALVGDVGLIRTLAEFGVVLLLFMVGLEFSLADLRRLGRVAFVAGLLQVALTVAVVAALVMAAGQHPARAIFLGMLVSLSSTAVVLKLLGDRLELSSPHGRLATGVLVVQDLVAVLFLLATPALGAWLSRGGAGTSGEFGIGSVLRPLAHIAAAALALAAAQRLLPWLISRVSRGNSREVFLFGVAVVALGAAYLASQLGASLALGAFLAGLLLAESDLRTRVAADVLPFRDIFASVFFVAMGMSVAPRVVIEQPLLVLASTVGLVLVKGVLVLLALRASGASWRVATAASIVLAQIGEFSFVVAQAGSASGLLDEPGARAFATGAVFSLMVTPLLVARAPSWALRLSMRLPVAKGAGPSGAQEPEAPPSSELLSDHVVIAGAGLNGRNVARVLRAVRLPHVVVDLNPDVAQLLLQDGSRTLVGDVSQDLVQRHAGVSRARVIVFALSDPHTTRHACRVARQLAPRAFIVVRTRYVSEIEELYALGANQVIPEEFETSIEIFTAVLQHLRVPTNLIDAQILLLRREHYGLMRGRKLPASVVEQLDVILEEGLTDTFLLLQHSPAVGRTLGELGLEASGARLIALVRAGEAITTLDSGLRLMVGDTLVLTGSHAQVERAFELLGD